MNLFVWDILLRKNLIVTIMDEGFALCYCRKVMSMCGFALQHCLRAIML
jgi:hypothetical protein